MSSSNVDVQRLFLDVGTRLISQGRTMISRERLLNAGTATCDVITRGVEGAIVECGTYRGGGLAFMALINEATGANRQVWGFDTFAGIPAPSTFDGRKSAGRGKAGDLLATESDCIASFRTAGVKCDPTLVPGLFQDTLSVTKDKIGAIAVLRLDGDWYESTRVCLEQLYDQVNPGGYVIIDDYGHWEGCRKAVDEFREVRGISSPLKKTDYTEVFWVK